jgi:DNA-binding MarR family transcriptional regulator
MATVVARAVAKRRTVPRRPVRPLTDQECRDMSASCVCFQLRKSARAVTQHFDDAFAAFGLTSTQFTLLAAVSTMGPTSVGKLSRWLVADASTLSRNVALLQRRKLLRSTAAADRRVRDVVLTDAGRTALSLAYPAWKRAQSAIADDFGAGQLRATMAVLGRMIERTRARH